MRTPRRLAPFALVGVLALAGCSGGTPTDDNTRATAPATVETATATPTASAAPTDAPALTPPPTPTPDPVVPDPVAPDPVMPALHSRTYEQAQAEFTRLGLSPARLTAAAQHKDVALSRDHDGWYVCDTSPRPGAPLTAATTVTVRLAEDFSDCTTSFHGYLHQENDPAFTP
ncbi:PASTA domain-containing protein [Streptomyces sp. NPDC007346]|uniref:PASTA domain-containing protein n=1 Tax=Streptomyces sp. NPDC007346 TaxID=3154682 RepID=UPI003454714E